MAAEDEVNIKLNTKSVEQQLKNIDTRTKRTGRMATENINALVKAQDKRARLMNKINELEAKGLNVARLRKQMGQATNELAKKRFGSLQQEFRVLERNVRLEESKLRIMRSQAIAARDRAKFLAGASVGRGQFGPAAPGVQGPRQMIASPIGGATDIKGSPAFLARQRRNQRLEQVGLGAGFPLLFGGGAGSVLGGGLGGLTGSFGAQIAFSAIGQQIDQFIGSITETGKAFGSLEGVLELIRERSLFTSKSSEELARQLEDLGDVEGLAELATIELASKIGSDGIGAFQNLETEVDEFDRLVGNLMISLQAFLAGPLSNFLEIINATLGKKVTQGTIDRLAGSLDDPAERTRFRAAAKERIGTELEIQGFGMGGLPKSAEVLKSAPLDLLGQLSREVAEGKFGESNLLSRPLKVTQQDREVFKPKSIKPDREAEKAAREEARIQKRLKNLEEERKKIIEISRFKDKIASAEAARDEQLVIRLKGEQQVAEIEAKRKQSLIDITDQRLIDAINVEAATEKLVTQRDTERELVELQRQKDQQRMDDMQRFIEQQYELNEAVKQQLALADGIAQVMGKGIAESFDLLISGAKNWGAALKDIAANVLRDIARQLIQIYVIEQAVGFLRNFLTPFDPSTPLGAGSGQIGKFGTLGPNYGIPQFANGGNPPVGRPSIVGERGPELFVPNTAGTIIPNHAMGGANIVVNVDASGSQAQGNEPNAKALGAALGAAVQAELIKQKRPGGLLS